MNNILFFILWRKVKFNLKAGKKIIIEKMCYVKIKNDYVINCIRVRFKIINKIP